MEEKFRGSLIFAVMPAVGGDDREVVLLVRSIREFGGQFADNPVWVIIPNDIQLRVRTSKALQKENVRIIPFSAPDSALDFPFATKVYAASVVEGLARTENVDLLVWMDPDTIVIQEPSEFLLEKNYMLGCRPVQLTLISSPLSDPLDSFWSEIYQDCGVFEARVFGVVTTVDHRHIRANYNAGLLVLRPQLGLLNYWATHFDRLYRKPFFEPFYQHNILYKFFIHQCVLAGSILAKVTEDQIKEFSQEINYPVFNHPRVPDQYKAESWNSLIIARYDEYQFFSRSGWRGILSINEPLSEWLEAQLKAL
jgi:hypothetical protein